MKNGGSRTQGNTYAKWALFLTGFIYSFAVLYVLRTCGYSRSFYFVLFGMLLVSLAYRSYSASFDFFIVWCIFPFFAGVVPLWILYLSFVTVMMVFLGYITGSRIAVLITWFSAAAWCCVYLADGKTPGVLGAIFILTSVISLLIYTSNMFSRRRYNIKKVDVILCSYSTNTAHYTHKFMEGVRKSGSEINLHRFHYHKTFDAHLTGDALVIAFPVYGWKPPWTLVEYMVRRLPRGEGKPAFILYSSAGGPENAGFVTWLLLKFKGYRLLGRSWAAYPINVVTFRIGPAILWKYLDRIFPARRDLEFVKNTGEEFAKGKRTGMPHLFLPFPLFIVGFILENRFVNRYLYKTYVWKWRCTKCKICVDYCPSQRFSLKDGIPGSKGECTLCLSCINLCPENAMQMVLLSEYGNPYKPRWPEYLTEITKNRRIK